MDLVHYLQQFGLTSDEMKLRILNCSNENFPSTPNILSIESKRLNSLPFPEQSFDLALCYKVLFIQQDKFSQDFHLKILLELARVASEVRIFPLLNEQGKPSQYLGPLLQALQQKGFGVELKQVQTVGETDATGKGGKGEALLRMWNESCAVI